MARQKRTKQATPPTVAASNDNEAARKQIAPWPQVDKYPILLGSNLTLQYLTSAYRLCQIGYRYQFVDALDELLEKDPHAYAVLWQRICGVAGGKLHLIAAEAPKGSAEAARAEEIRVMTEARFRAIPRLQQHLADMLWGIYYGITAAEVCWERREDGWHVTDLGFIHSRRLSYPDTATWDLRVWDQGGVRPGLQWTGASWQWPTGQLFGVRVHDYPGKFLVFAPKLRGDYPTREGVGREVGWYMAMKLMAVRGAGQFVERFVKPWVLGYYNTKTVAGGNNPRVADEPDIAAANAAAGALGLGSLSSAILPDSIKFELDGPGIKGNSAGTLNHQIFIELMNAEISKAVRGSTLTTETATNGNRALGEVHEHGDIRNARYDATCLSESLQDLSWWLCHLNYPGEEHLASKVQISVEDLKPAELIALAAQGAAAGLPVDADAIGDRTGLPLLEPGDTKGRRMAPIKPADLFSLLPTEMLAPRLAELVETLATTSGVSLTPSDRNKLAAMPEASVAALITGLMTTLRKGTTSGGEQDETQPEHEMAQGEPAK